MLIESFKPPLTIRFYNAKWLSQALFKKKNTVCLSHARQKPLFYRYESTEVRNIPEFSSTNAIRDSQWGIGSSDIARIRSLFLTLFNFHEHVVRQRDEATPNGLERYLSRKDESSLYF